MKTSSLLNTRLRRFLIVSLILHIIVGCATMIPYVVKRHLEEQRRLAEHLARQAARKKAEEENRAAAREMAREKIEETLKQDAYEFLIDSVDELDFETIWGDILVGLNVDIESLLEQLEQAGYDFSSEQLQEMMAKLRSAELQHILNQINALAKEQIAVWLLKTFEQSLPEFNARVEQVLESLTDDTEAKLQSVVAAEKTKREGAAQRALASLEKTEAQIARAEQGNDELMSAISKTKDQMEAATPVKKQGDDSDDPDGQESPQTGPHGEGAGGPIKPNPSHGADGPGGGSEAPGLAKSAGLSTSRKSAMAEMRRTTTKSLLGIDGSLKNSHHNMLLAARNADATGEAAVADGLRDSARDVEDIGQSSVARTKALLTKRPEDIKQPSGSPAAPRARALRYDDPKRLLEAAQRQSEATAEALSKVSEDLANQKAALRGIGEAFEKKADSAVADLYTGDNEARADARAFLDDTLRRDIAEDYRKRAEKIVNDVMNSRKIEPDPGFVMALGQKAVDTLLGEGTREMRERAFDKLLAEAGEKYGVDPYRARPDDETDLDNAASESKPEDGDTSMDTPPDDGPDGSGGEDPEAPGFPIDMGPSGEGSHDEGTSASDVKSLDSGEGTQGSDDSGGQSVDPELLEKVNKAMADMAEYGIGHALRQAESTLNLPDPNSFGPGPLGLSLRVIQAMNQRMKQTPTGGTHALIDLGNDLDMIGSMQRTGMNRMVLVGDRELNYAEYRKNIEAVIKDRKIEETVLSAEALKEDVSAAEAHIGNMRHATILVAEESEEEVASGRDGDEDRSLSEPNFKAFAYGGAPMTFEEPIIDGDLSEWEELDVFALRARVKKQGGYSEASLPKKWDSNRILQVQWNLKGFYFAWRMVDDRDNTDWGRNSFWRNDSLELWFDFANKRADTMSHETQQFWFWPLGSAQGPETVGGEGKTSRGYNDARFKQSRSADAPRMAVKRVSSPRGYQVELFLPSESFANPDLRPGRVIAFNYSINNGEECYLRWTANLGRREAETPSLWGDLLLLGTDAVTSIVKPGTEDALVVIVPGEPIGIQVKDLDMNTDRALRNRIKVTLAAHNGDQVTGYLEETDVDTGIFEGSVDTELFLLQQEERFADSVLQIAGGEKIEVRYFDEARQYGERNFQAKSAIPVGLPVLDLAAGK